MERAPMDDGQKPSQNDHELRITALERAMTGIEAEIRQLRQHMNDGFALLRDALAEIVKRLDRQDDRMDRFEKKLDKIEGRVDRFELRVDARFDKMDARFDKMDARFDQMASLLRWAIGLMLAVLVAVLGGEISLLGVVLQRLL
ncbi:hypothetical protein [Pseudoduganella sp. OTU4001]|uniref:hypothetical protein n=1 Tax=Pseudoduganella sp. OTU4001 TaxID=3043854 RepID=UPI00313EF2AF